MDESNDYLIHYGVLGMKWGVRRASRKGSSYSYKSLSTKRAEKKKEKILNKVDKAKNNGRKRKTNKLQYKADKQSRIIKNRQLKDKRIEDYARNTSVKKALGQKAIFGVRGGSKMYAKSRAAGQSRVKSAAKAILRDPIAHLNRINIASIVGTASLIAGKKIAENIIASKGNTSIGYVSKVVGISIKNKARGVKYL